MNNALSMEYIAGFFDGEGCVVISSQKRKYLSDQRINHNMVATISGIDPRPLHAIMDIFGGNMTLTSKQKHSPRPVWRWSISGPKAEKFLISIMDYCIVKKDQIIKALEFRKLVRSPRGLPRLTIDELAKREQLKKELSDLKRQAWLM